MNNKGGKSISLIAGMLVLLFATTPGIATDTWECKILPSENRVTIDPVSNAKIVFITSHESDDTNLYFHDRSWLFNDRLVIFNSNRFGNTEIFGYVLKTGELVRLDEPGKSPAHSPLAASCGDVIYVVRGSAIFQWKLTLAEGNGTKLSVTEKKICDFPPGSKQFSGLNENANGSLISFGYILDDNYIIAIADVNTGTVQKVTQPQLPAQHIQFHWTRPDLIAFASSYGNDTAPLEPANPPHARINFVNTNTRLPLIAFYQVPGELVTHECWWVNDQITFIGGHRPGEGHVKVMDLKSGEIRIIGAGAWWADASESELAKVNWWHAAGSRNGKWVAADNWHGIVAVFDAQTTEMRILTQGHRIYGGGAHPHVGWDLNSKKVVFTSNKFGNADVCIGYIPKDW